MVRKEPNLSGVRKLDQTGFLDNLPDDISVQKKNELCDQDGAVLWGNCEVVSPQG